MSPEKMVHMANQIATFFKTQPGTDQAARVAAHLTDYWEPRMRQQLRAFVDAGGKGLDDIAVRAAHLIE
ncbi:MAG: formate dehydrogenase subunit delta [Roseovarius sp.]|uniref:formate dehydrogenase subunit delta n=1 Tax=Roseovarius sp. TaxID=1486281 RepID=UPI001B4A7AE5|nr:formate dehydrogenase subunit delta [Roseovarius sp.]MBQ0748908.1 formate dehydrogenase subunit delta [Roseovarius sp.]MBQ0809888.1 formate dehydrogenase subunit delta [Roseovarius sp.]